MANTVIPTKYSPQHEQPAQKCSHISVNGNILIEIHHKKWPPAECSHCHFPLYFPTLKIPLKQPWQTKPFILFCYKTLGSWYVENQDISQAKIGIHTINIYGKRSFSQQSCICDELYLSIMTQLCYFIFAITSQWIP